jgi:hypothetical protein
MPTRKEELRDVQRLLDQVQRQLDALIDECDREDASPAQTGEPDFIEAWIVPGNIVTTPSREGH